MGAALAVLLTALVPVDAAAEQVVGHVDMEEFRGARSVDATGVERFIYFRDQVNFEEMVVTASREETAIQLLDESKLQIGENSNVLLDRFVYDPDKNVGDAAIEFGTGVFRFVSGDMSDEGYVLTTPAATLSIRGTAFRLRVEEDGTTIVYVEEGKVVLEPCGGEVQEGLPGFSLIAEGDCSTSSVATGDLTDTETSFADASLGDGDDDSERTGTTDVAGDDGGDGGDGDGDGGDGDGDGGDGDGGDGDGGDGDGGDGDGDGGDGDGGDGDGGDGDGDSSTNNKGLGNGGDSAGEGASERDNGHGLGKGLTK